MVARGCKSPRKTPTRRPSHRPVVGDALPGRKPQRSDDDMSASPPTPPDDDSSRSTPSSPLGSDRSEAGAASGGLDAYQPPAYLARQAAQARPLSFYATRVQRRVGGAVVGLLAIAIIGACIAAGASASGGAPSTVAATQTPNSAAFGGGTPQATDTPHATATPSPTNTATATPRPTATATSIPIPTDTPVPAPPTCIPGAVNCNPWGYNFTPGNLIYNVPAMFC
jgi:hypothetical protein